MFLSMTLCTCNMSVLEQGMGGCEILAGRANDNSRRESEMCPGVGVGRDSTGVKTKCHRPAEKSNTEDHVGVARTHHTVLQTQQAHTKPLWQVSWDRDSDPEFCLEHTFNTCRFARRGAARVGSRSLRFRVGSPNGRCQWRPREQDGGVASVLLCFG